MIRPSAENFPKDQPPLIEDKISKRAVAFISNWGI